MKPPQQDQPITAPIDERARKVRELQAVMEGATGKYLHADARDDGSTQIGGITTRTRSMCGGTNELGAIAGKLAAGKAPFIQNSPGDFRF